MNTASALARHPAALLAAVLLGLWLGVLWPAGTAVFTALAAVYLALLQAVALPFIALAVFFGLQRVPAARAHWHAWAVLALPALLAMPLCALAGALLASVGAAGAGMDAAMRQALGHLVLDTSDAAVNLFDGSLPSAAAMPPMMPQLVPHNLYAVLAGGALPSVLVGVALFGAAVAAQRRGEGHLEAILEAAYRGLEAAIGCINRGLPLTAFVLAAAAAGAAQGAAGLMLGFLGTWLAAALLACAAAATLICWRLGARPGQLLAALREPVTVCLFAPVGAAALPEFIEALCARLGCNRGAAELVMPVAPVFVRSGEALGFAVLAVFIADLYGHGLSMRDVGLVVALSCWSALCGIGTPGMRTVLWSGVLQASLGLPLEALLPPLAAVEALCAGPRNLVSYFTAALLVTLAPGPRQPLRVVPAASNAPALVLVMRPRRALLGAGLLAAALLAVFAAGLGFGLRRALLAAP